MQESADSRQPGTRSTHDLAQWLTARDEFQYRVMSRVWMGGHAYQQSTVVDAQCRQKLAGNRDRA